GTLDRFNIHDGWVDNSGGQTPVAVSLTGWDNSSPLTDSRLANLVVNEGQVQLFDTLRCTVGNVAGINTGAGPMAGAPDALFFGFQYNDELLLENLNLQRLTGAAAGLLLQINNGATLARSPYRVTIRGGRWRTQVAGNGTRYVQFQDVDR